MVFTFDEKQALARGEAVTVTVDGLPCVVLRREKYDRVVQLLEFDDAESDPRDSYPSVLRAWDADDEDPDQYLEYLDDQPR